MYNINSRLLSCCTFNQIITVNSFTNAPITKKLLLLALRAYVFICLYFSTSLLVQYLWYLGFFSGLPLEFVLYFPRQQCLLKLVKNLDHHHQSFLFYLTFSGLEDNAPGQNLPRDYNSCLSCYLFSNTMFRGSMKTNATSAKQRLMKLLSFD